MANRRLGEVLIQVSDTNGGWSDVNDPSITDLEVPLIFTGIREAEAWVERHGQNNHFYRPARVYNGLEVVTTTIVKRTVIRAGEEVGEAGEADEVDEVDGVDEVIDQLIEFI